jgi:hypothetical protein
VIFESEESAAAGILEGKVKAGDVVVIRYEGPRGGPGMQEMLAPTANIMGRGSNSPFVERVWRSHSARTGVFHSIAACSWDIVVMRLEGRTTLIVRGPETKATMADCPPQGEWFGVRFKPAPSCR